MRNTMFFPLEVGLHQSSAISPYIFALILDELSRGIQENIPWCMIFADDIVLIAESAKGLNNRLEIWREALEDNSLRVSREKTECLKCDFGRVEMPELRILRWTCDKTMLDMIPNEVFKADFDVDFIIDKMREGRLRWFEHVKRRPQTATARNVEAVVEMPELRILRWTCDKTMLDMIPNEVFKADFDVDFYNRQDEGRKV
ncbi:retrovirus-related pol polyprotein LINE-1 [Tanacetum coccineum]